MRALERARPGVPVEAGVEAELPAELVAEVAEDGVLVGVEHGPEGDRVDQLRVAEPPLEEDHDPVRVDVVAAVDRALVPEVIGEGLLAGHLVDVAHQRVAADRQLAGAAPPDEEAVAGVELPPGLDRVTSGFAGARCEPGAGRRGRRGLFAQLELAAAAVRHPHALVVVAPGLTEQTRGRAGATSSARRRPTCRPDRRCVARLRFADEQRRGRRDVARKAQRRAQRQPMLAARTVPLYVSVAIVASHDSLSAYCRTPMPRSRAPELRRRSGVPRRGAALHPSSSQSRPRNVGANAALERPCPRQSST